MDGLRLFQRWRIDFILWSVEYVEMLHRLFLVECYELIKIL
nr:MAG TPA: hypothetical protein [Caudoviricetes sp.]